jgi:acyl-CoA synthetase (AMP-forming)/AMP-acid ligase II
LFTIGEGLTLNAQRYPDKPAVRIGDLVLTYAEFNARVNRAAHALAGLGLAKGDHLALMLPNGLAMAELQLATAKLGLVAVPVNVRLAAPELRYVLDHSDSKALVAEGEFLDRLALAGGEGGAGALLPPRLRTIVVAGDGGPGGLPRYEALRDAAPAHEPDVEVDGDDTWIIVYTSGTTGRPKGAVRSHKSNVLLALTFASDFGITADDTGLLIMPMFHVNSIWFLSLSLYLGATCAIHAQRAFHPERLVEDIRRHEVTYSIFVPTMLSYLVQAARAGQLDGNRLRVLLSSSAPLPSALRDGVLAAFPAAHLYEIYGSTETGAVTNIRHRAGGPIGSVGHPGLAQRVRILDANRRDLGPNEVGEIFCLGPTLMDGYYKDPEATAAAMHDGYLSVGDMGYRDEAGRVYIVDRKADMIITSGENVYPTEVEDVILRAPGVLYVAVIGVPDDKRGEAVRAFVVPRPDGPPPDIETIQRLCREHLADYKRPRSVEIVPELPLGPTGKVLRRAVRAPFWQGRERPI